MEIFETVTRRYNRREEIELVGLIRKEHSKNRRLKVLEGRKDYDSLVLERPVVASDLAFIREQISGLSKAARRLEERKRIRAFERGQRQFLEGLLREG